MFTARTPLEVSAGGRIALTPVTSDDDFAITPDGIRIRRAGVYLVTYTVHVPAFQNFSSQMYLTLNGETIAASQQDVTKLSDSTSTGSTAQVLVQANENSLLALTSANAFTLSPTNSAANVFTLSIVRVA